MALVLAVLSSLVSPAPIHGPDRGAPLLTTGALSAAGVWFDRLEELEPEPESPLEARRDVADAARKTPANPKGPIFALAEWADPILKSLPHPSFRRYVLKVFSTRPQDFVALWQWEHVRAFFAEVAALNPRLAHLNMVAISGALLRRPVNDLLPENERAAILRQVGQAGLYPKPDPTYDATRLTEEVTILTADPATVFSPTFTTEEVRLVKDVTALYNFQNRPPPDWQAHVAAVEADVQRHNAEVNRNAPLGVTSTAFLTSYAISHYTKHSSTVYRFIQNWAYAPSPLFEDTLISHLDQQGLHPRERNIDGATAFEDEMDHTVDALLLDMALRRLNTPAETLGRPPLTPAQRAALQMGVVWLLARYKPADGARLLSPAEFQQIRAWAKQVAARDRAASVHLRDIWYDVGTRWLGWQRAPRDLPINVILSDPFAADHQTELGRMGFTPLWHKRTTFTEILQAARYFYLDEWAADDAAPEAVRSPAGESA